jgi:hypothetical protein
VLHQLWTVFDSTTLNLLLARCNQSIPRVHVLCQLVSQCSTNPCFPRHDARKRLSKRDTAPAPDMHPRAAQGATACAFESLFHATAEKITSASRTSGPTVKATISTPSSRSDTSEEMETIFGLLFDCSLPSSSKQKKEASDSSETGDLRDARPLLLV